MRQALSTNETKAQTEGFCSSQLAQDKCLFPQVPSQGIPKHATALRSGKQGCPEGVLGAQYLPFERQASVLLVKRNLGWSHPFSSEGAGVTVTCYLYLKANKSL